ncbi:MAG: undecaprenyldiphospho-muramoylpentapeptide beta-N-acetylglucosaminyltransferase [Dethiobacteria bacterium]
MRLILTGGGTGGHIYPALALGRYIKKVNPGADILFVGAQGGLEERIVPQAGFAMKTLPVKGIPRRLSPQLFKAFTLLGGSLINATKILEDFGPDFVVGTGGYAAAPIIMASIFKGRKFILHEQNVIPGVTNRFLAPWAYRVCLSFPSSARYFFRRANLVTTGNPRASEVGRFEKSTAREMLGMEKDLPLVLAVGGSRGALKLNESMVDFLAGSAGNKRLQVLYITGDIYYEGILADLEARGLLEKYGHRLKVQSFQPEMPLCMAAADLIITRAGATTLAEITALGLPAIIVPSPNVVHNHQLLNARELAEQGAAELIEEKDLNGNVLGNYIEDLLNSPGKLANLQKNSKKIAFPQAAENIYRLMH